MKQAKPNSLLTIIAASHREWQNLPLIERIGDGWAGSALMIPPPSESNVAFDLDIEEVAEEVTISFDYAHIHMPWPPQARSSLDQIWWDAQALVEAILSERVVASSGWIDGELRVGSLHEADGTPDLMVPALQHLRVRSWLGTFNHDETLNV